MRRAKSRADRRCAIRYPLAAVLNPLRWLQARRETPVPLVLYTKRGCCLCDQMKSALAAARLSRPYELSEVDIETDARLNELYGRSIPVLAIGGRVAFKGRIGAGELERKFERLAREWSSGREAQES